MRGPGSFLGRALRVVAIPQSGLLSQVSSLRLPLGHSGPVLTLSKGVSASLFSPHLPVHPAQALGCSARDHLRLALGRMHLPGLSRSGSGTRVVLRGTDLLGLSFMPFPYLSSSGDEVFGECGHCDLSHALSLLLGFLDVQPAHLLRRMITVQNPKKS